MKIGFYKCNIKKGRNAEFKIHMLYNYDKDWPENVLARRGLAGNRFFVRDATKEEQREARSQFRAFSLKYRSLHDLVEDERRCGIEESIIHNMIAAYKEKRR